MWTPSLITPPTAEPVTPQYFRLHSRLELLPQNEDLVLVQKLKAAREQCESYTERQIMPATWEIWADHWCLEGGRIWIPRPSLQSVTSVKYRDSDGLLQTLAPTEYVVTAPQGPRTTRGWIEPAYGVSWPILRSMPAAVVVRFVAGWTSEQTVPQGIKEGICLRAAELYERREEVTTGTIVSANPRDAHHCWSEFRALT